MIKYSPIGPIPVLQELHTKGLLGDYLLLLAHDVLEHPHEYADLIADIFTEVGEATIIMDNGVVENGAPVSLDQLLEASQIVEADIVVGPDSIGDYEATKKQFMEQADIIRQDYSLMLVPQGESLEEICECVRWMDERFPTPGPQWWGIPRWIANEHNSRSSIINYINNYARGSGDIKIHLLGMSHNLEDDIHCAKTLSVVGIDSANPLVLGYHGIKINGVGEHHMERGDYWATTEINGMMQYNVEWLRDVVGART